MFNFAALASTVVTAGKGDPMWLDNPVITNEFLPATIDTLLMTLWSTLFTVIFGIPLGLVIVATAPGGLWPNRVVNQSLSFLVNIGRSLPFLILIVAALPLTKFIMGTTLGWAAAVIPLVLSAIPFFARLVETAVLSVDHGKIEAVQMMGATRSQIMFGVQVREAFPALIQSTTVLVIALLGYAAIAGTVGAGGLGALVMNYGYTRFQADVMITAVVVIIVIVQIIQMTGDMLSRRVDHR